MNVPATLPGPCAVCGEIDYLPSMGGPDICPACDCGAPLRDRLDYLRAILATRDAEIAELRAQLGITGRPGGSDVNRG